MENANSPEYLEKIKNQLIENLRRTAHVPSVQMQDVPRHSMGAMTDEDDAELNDLDEDENKDVRMTQRQWEQRIERDDEYDVSDNEEMEKANGVRRNGSSRRPFHDYRNSDVEGDSGVATPANGTTESIIKSKEVDEVVMKDVEDTTGESAGEKSEATANPKADEIKPEKGVGAVDVTEQEKTLPGTQESSKSSKSDEKSEKAAVQPQESTEKLEQNPKEDEVMQDAEDEAKQPEDEAAQKKIVEPEATKLDKEPVTDGDGDVDMDEVPADKKPNDSKTGKVEETIEAPASTLAAEKPKDTTTSS